MMISTWFMITESLFERRSRPPTVAPSRCQIVFRNELDPWKSLSGFGIPKVRKTPSLSSLPRNDLNILSEGWSHHTTGTRDLVIQLLGHYGPPFSECGWLFSGCEQLDDSPPHLQHYINRRVVVKLPQHLLLLYFFVLPKNLTNAEACSSYSQSKDHFALASWQEGAS
jgi:hypothetical protein